VEDIRRVQKYYPIHTDIILEYHDMLELFIFYFLNNEDACDYSHIIYHIT